MNALSLGRLNARTFRETVPSRPHNAVLFSEQVLAKVLRDDMTSSEARRIARAELAVRYFLSLSTRKFSDDAAIQALNMDVVDELSAWIGESAFKDFMAECAKCELMDRPTQQAERAFRKLTESDCGLSGKNSDILALRSAFLPWLTAEGVIPVFNVEGTYLLPFSFGEEEVTDPRVLDWTGKELSTWTKSVQSMKVGVNRDVKVAIEQCDYVRDVGDSLMLPVLMAWWRNHVDVEKRLPRYSPIRFVATGSFVGNAVGEVRTEEKSEKIRNDVRDGFLVCPGNGLDPGTIPTGIGLEQTISCIREMAELRYDADPGNAAKRLVALERSVRGGRHERWSLLIARLDRLWKVQDKDLDDEAYLMGLMLRSAARCHVGKTKEALELNKEAMEFARRDVLFLPQLLRLRIEQLVLLQDSEDFSRTFELAADLENDIVEFAQSENDSDRAVDLKMRYYGTMGQAIAYASMTGLEGCSPERAKANFDFAFKNAVELAKRSKVRTGCSNETNVAIYNCGQDANYQLLWEALFNPEGVPKAAEKAKTFADRNRENGDLEDAVKNDRYRHRFAAFGLYRATLLGKEVPTLAEYAHVEREMAEPDCDAWIRATIGKYLGAVAAAQGDAVTASLRFKDAAELLAGKSDSIFKVILMTVFSEAYRSLRRFPEHAALAMEMRKSALDLFDGSDSSGWGKESWYEWLQTEGVDKQFPGLNYWY